MFGLAALTGAISRALDNLPASVDSIAVGVSGGADSAMLAVHAAAALDGCRRGLHIFHVHHGLQQVSTQWQSHVHDLAQALRLPCHSLCVQVGATAGVGMEAAARDARYADRKSTRLN